MRSNLALEPSRSLSLAIMSPRRAAQRESVSRTATTRGATFLNFNFLGSVASLLFATNVVFELGLRIPTDLTGVTPGRYDPNRSDKNLQAAPSTTLVGCRSAASTWATQSALANP